MPTQAAALTPPLPETGWTPPRAEPVRRRTLILLRWVAIAGQLAAVAAAVALGIGFDHQSVAFLIACAVALNLTLMLRRQRPLSSGHVTLHLGFDIAQLAGLIAVTGGLSNPFALLVLAPVTIAATVLGRRQTVVLGLATGVLVLLAALIARPLTGPDGAVLALPWPLALGHGAGILIGIAFFASYAHRVTSELSATTNALFATQLALEREQRLQHLGGVVAAAAHEMGSPLGTIKLIAGELAEDLADRPDLHPDLRDLTQSADRCTAILRSMGRAGKDDLWLRRAPLLTLLSDAAAPHADRGVRVTITGEGPEVRRDPGVIHALRNLIQNAVDHAAGAVAVHAETGPEVVRVTIRDDGPGFAPAVLPRLGDPHPPVRGPRSSRKPGDGMGLGLFIAKTLLERTGAVLTFANGGPGAVVTVRWPRARIAADSGAVLGDNPVILA